MFKEFYCNKRWRTAAFAWSGCVVFLCHQLFRAYLKRAINSWYERFYDLLGAHVSREVGSGHDADDVDHDLADARTRVWEELIDFAIIVAPAVVIHPVASWVRNTWILAWRLALTRSYLNRWGAASTIEGAAQRVHEDCMRFGRGIHSVVAQCVDSVLTLILFSPLLYARDPTLMYVALSTAIGGIGVSAIVGRHLVTLEVENQKVEAAFRTDLVKLELDAESFRQNGTIIGAFYLVLERLVANYRRLYKNFFFFGFWLSAFEQTMTVLPYVILAPRLFAANPDDALTLGQLTASASAFDKVFGAITVISEDWMGITEWLSVLRRLREFERALDNTRRPRAAIATLELVDAVATPSLDDTPNGRLSPVSSESFDRAEWAAA